MLYIHDILTYMYIYIHIFIYYIYIYIYIYLFIYLPSSTRPALRWCPAGASGTPEDVDAVSFLEISKKRAWQPWMLLGCWAKLRE